MNEAPREFSKVAVNHRGPMRHRAVWRRKPATPPPAAPGRLPNAIFAATGHRLRSLPFNRADGDKLKLPPCASPYRDKEANMAVTPPPAEH